MKSALKGTIKMKKSAFKREHKELLNILKNPTKKGLRKEIKEQGEEVKRVAKIK